MRTIYHCTTFGYSHAEWDNLLDYLRDVRWNNTFIFCPFAAVAEFCELFKVGIDVYIPHRKHQIKPYSSPWLSNACVAAITQRNHYFHL